MLPVGFPVTRGATLTMLQLPPLDKCLAMYEAMKADGTPVSGRMCAPPLPPTSAPGPARASGPGPARLHLPHLRRDLRPHLRRDLHPRLRRDLRRHPRRDLR
jgi:hypothetical protein